MRSTNTYLKRGELSVLCVPPGGKCPAIGHHLGNEPSWNMGQRWLDYWRYNTTMGMYEYDDHFINRGTTNTYFAVPLVETSNELGDIHP